ncbi:uncharacterized protein LTR77_008058 [Saxophila tyrrhenica]|uniref:MARVEL domain-containing protein n=1 Tax=Saxophila tyrrhenica TaxID=1690608 RepID=A0AAV9P1P4_9PEZI|nr:hypothetical protein LTR77_008058 [Saxophila tyrrhenica]
MASSTTMLLPDRLSKSTSPGRESRFLDLRTILLLLKVVFAVVVTALYGIDLHRATETSKRAQASWIFAEVVAALSMLTCAFHCVIKLKSMAWVFWNFVLFIFWTSLFGFFASLYLSPTKSNEEYSLTSSVDRMLAAVWIDLVNMLLWLVTFVQGVAWCCTGLRRSKETEGQASQMTGVESRRPSSVDEDEKSIGFAKSGKQDEALAEGERDTKRTTFLPSYSQTVER